MKKILAVLFVAAAMVTGAFAQEAEDSSFPVGSWVDENWNGEWVIEADRHVQLKDSVTGELIFDFTKDKITDVSFDPTAPDGPTYRFYCKETERAYKFIKSLTLSADLKLIINPDWDDGDDYNTTIKFKAPDLKNAIPNLG